MVNVTCEVLRDEAGVPTKIILKKGGRRLEIAYNRDVGFALKGQLIKDFRDILQATSVFGATAVDITAQTVGNLDVDINAQTIGNLDIDIAAQSLGNLAMEIAAQTVDIDIKTSGGTNIVIDKLIEEATYSEQHTLKYDDSPAGSVDGYTAVTGTNRYGKFYPRGCRGVIHTIDFYCRDNGAGGGTITFYIAPIIGYGAIYSGTVTVAAGGGGAFRASGNVHIPWNYDSMFVWWYTSGADIQVGYDSSEDDNFTSTDSGATWAVGATRYWIKLQMYAQTIGDLPVSGTINNVPIPSSSSATHSVAAEGIVATIDETVVTVNGAGYVDWIVFEVAAHADSEATSFAVKCDGTHAFFNGFLSFSSANIMGYSASSPKLSLLTYGADALCVMQLEQVFHFKNKLEIIARNLVDDQTVTVRVHDTLIS